MFVLILTPLTLSTTELSTINIFLSDKKQDDVFRGHDESLNYLDITREAFCRALFACLIDVSLNKSHLNRHNNHIGLLRSRYWLQQFRVLV